MTTTIELPMKREQSLLNLICLVVAAGFFILIVYNLFSAGTIISTDGLFFTVVPLVLALSFLAIPAQEFLSRRLERRSLPKADAAPQITARRSVPALKDARGRAMPPDVNLMVAQMKAPVNKEKV